MTRRLLLINPAQVLNGQQRGGASRFAVPPIGLGYVAAATPAGWAIHIIDENLRMGNGVDWMPDLVGITSLTPTAPRAFALAAQYRARGATVVLGGLHPSLLPDEAAQFADSVVIGDAEDAWPRLVADFEAGRLQSRYQSDFPPLVGLSVPRRDLYPGGYFAESLITSKGCPNACTFCSIWRFYDRRYRTRSIDEVLDELEGLPSHKIVFLADDNMTVDRRRVIALCRRMMERGIRCRYMVQGALGLADDAELLHWLRRSGCLFVFMGLESLTSQAIEEMGKPDLIRVGVRGYQRCIERIHDHGLAVYGSFIVGLDGDTPVTFEQVRRFTLSAGVDCAIINVLHPLPGTVLWDQMRREGRLLYTDFPADYALYSQDNVSFRPSGMTPAQLQEGTRSLIASLTRLPTALRRAGMTWRYTRSALATFTCLVWNWRSHRNLRAFPLQDVRRASI